MGLKCGVLGASTAVTIFVPYYQIYSMPEDSLESFLLKSILITGFTGTLCYTLVKLTKKIRIPTIKKREDGIVTGGIISAIVIPNAIGSNFGIVGRVGTVAGSVIFGTTFGSAIGGYLGRYFS